MKSIFLVGAIAIAALSPSWLPFGAEKTPSVSPLTAPPAVSIMPLHWTHDGF